MCVAYLLYVGFDPGVRRRKHVAGELHVSDDRQRFVGTLSVDADVALKKNDSVFNRPTTKRLQLRSVRKGEPRGSWPSMTA